jgi:hypothetical protein
MEDPTDEEDCAIDEDGDVSEEAGGLSDHAAITSSDEDSDSVEDGLTVEGHFDVLQERGTFSIEHVLKYSKWGELELSEQEAEILLFLRSVESGGGQSNGATQCSLDYVRSTGGRGVILPKTVNTCWHKVRRVSLMREWLCTMFTLMIIMLFIYVIVNDRHDEH